MGELTEQELAAIVRRNVETAHWWWSGLECAPPQECLDVDALVEHCMALRKRAERAEAEVRRLKVLIAWRHGVLWDLATSYWPILCRLAGVTDLAELARRWQTAASEGAALVREEAKDA